MGVYTFVFNLDKRESLIIPPLRLGGHIMEARTPIVLYWVLFHKKSKEYPFLGRWGGDRVVVGENDKECHWIIEEMARGGFRNITVELCRDAAEICKILELYLHAALFEDVICKYCKGFDPFK